MGALPAEMEPRGLALRDMGVAYGELPGVGEVAPGEYRGERCSREFGAVLVEVVPETVDM